MDNKTSNRTNTRIKDTASLARENLRVARRIFGPTLTDLMSRTLTRLSNRFGFSLESGDLRVIGDSWYVTHAGLLAHAARNGCSGIIVEAVDNLSDSALCRYVFKATVFRSKNCTGFVGYGDADPSNVSPLVRGAEMRVAETRAVNRALRKAYGIGICSAEELKTNDGTGESSTDARKRGPQPANGNGWATGPRVRDLLCQLIRKHELDPDLVKAYATDFCGVKTLREASREQVEAFVQTLADWAEKDRNALLCQLNSYFRVTKNVERKDGAA